MVTNQHRGGGGGINVAVFQHREPQPDGTADMQSCPLIKNYEMKIWRN
jgi:hypothetical protein